MSDPRREANRRLWDGWTDLHRDSAFYDVEGFRRGESSLKTIERTEMGEVRGKSLLHLQCHFGLDTLSWGRLGARVTGVDLSPRSIELARSLAAESPQVDSRFLAADLYALDDALDETFDIVFTSYGVLWWLEDLDGWARIVARHLKPGGRFYIVEFHPMTYVLDEATGRPRYDYIGRGEAFEERMHGSYAAPEADFEATCFGWQHDLGSVVSAIAGTGLRVEFLHEFDTSPWRCGALTEPAGPGQWVVPGLQGKIPVLFSLAARR